MTHIDTGTTTRKRTKARPRNPANLSELLIAVHNANPIALEREELEEFLRRGRENLAYGDEGLTFFYRMRRGPLLNPSKVAVRQSPAERAASAERAAKVAAIADRVLIDGGFLMPNGEKLRDCTGAYVAKLGGVFAKIAEKVKPNQKIGDVWSDKELRKLSP